MPPSAAVGAANRPDFSLCSLHTYCPETALISSIFYEIKSLMQHYQWTYVKSRLNSLTSLFSYVQKTGHSHIIPGYQYYNNISAIP
jgi:hypothetical protein